MPDWRIKGVIQGALSRTPGGVALNDVLQLTVGGRRRIEAYVADKVNNWGTLAGLVRESGGVPAEAHWAEIGTGWLPVLPVCFSLLDAGMCVSFDLSRHLHRSATARLPKLLEPHVARIGAAAGKDAEEVRAKIGRLVRAPDAETLLRMARIEYRAPADFARSGLPADSVDVVFSNSVLEHLPRETLDAVLVESRRVLKPGGRVVHGVACGDHYADFDPSITRINYLRFTEEQWRRWNNRILFQNRLRAGDFLETAERAGLSVVSAQMSPRPELLAAFSRLPIAPEFRGYTPEQLCTTSVNFVARKP